MVIFITFRETRYFIEKYVWVSSVTEEGGGPLSGWRPPVKIPQNLSKER